MTNTTHQTRLEKLAKVAKVLETVTSAIAKDHPLTLKQRVSMVLAIGELQAAVNQLRIWSIGS